MNNKQHIFFDLDGTLINSENAVLFCVNYAINQMGLPDLAYETKLKFLGPPLADSFMRYCGLDEKAAAQALQHFRFMYSTKGVHMASLYNGIEDMLHKIFQSGKKIYTATSKPEKFAKIILNELNIAKYFSVVAGASLDESRVTKIDVLNYALQKADLTDMSDCVLVGDRCFDVEGAHVAKMDCIGALWGFGSKKELENAGADEICAKPVDVADFLCNI